MGVDHGHAPFNRAHLNGWVPEALPNPGCEFDPLTTTASDLSKMLAAGKATSVDILCIYYRQILMYNGYLKAVYQLAPGALDRALELDNLRRRGRILGPLHGIPVLLKDNIGTERYMGMTNTGGNLALVGSFTRYNARIVGSFSEPGQLFLGRQPSRGTGIRCGWSPVHGQSQNPYIDGGIDPTDGPGGHSSPGGSSSGSAIAVAAGFAPIAVGTETEGSLISPSTRQSLWTIKPTLLTVHMSEIMPVNDVMDIAGPICKSVEDTVTLLKVLQRPDYLNRLNVNYDTAMRGARGWRDLRVGTLDPDVFRYDETFQTAVPEAIHQIKTATLDAYRQIGLLAGEYHHHVDLLSDKSFEYDGKNSLKELMACGFELCFDRYLQGTTNTKILSLKDLVAWNKKHFRAALPPEYPNQDFLEHSIAVHASDAESIGYNVEYINMVSHDPDRIMEQYNIDVIIGPADSNLTRFSAVNGYPLCSLPLGYIPYNGRPIGLVAMAKSEITLITLMSAFEATFPSRKPPTAFLKHGVETDEGHNYVASFQAMSI